LVATCDLASVSVVDWNISAGGYDPFDSGNVSETVAVGSSKCGSQFVTISRGNSNDPSYDRIAYDGANELHYQIYKNASPQPTKIIKDVPDLTGADSIVSTLKFYVTVPPQQLVEGGIYYDTVTLTLYDGSWDAPGNILETKTIQIKIVVQNYILLDPTVGSILDNLNLDFGELETGEIQTGLIRVISNNRYDVTLRSQNSQVMKHIINPAGTTVPYTFDFNNSAVNLTSGTAVTVVSNAVNTSGTNYDFDVTIGDVTNKDSGDYQDIVYLDFVERL